MTSLNNYIGQEITVDYNKGSFFGRATGKLESVNTEKGTATFSQLDLSEVELIKPDGSPAPLASKIEHCLRNPKGFLGLLYLEAKNDSIVSMVLPTDSMRVVKTQLSE